MKAKKVIIPVICLCIAVPSAVFFSGRESGGNVVNKLRHSLAPKTISSKSTDLTAGMSSRINTAELPEDIYDEEFRLADNTFALELFKNEISDSENVIISPYSAIQSLGMLANGADGDTLNEIQSAMGGMDIAKLNEYLCKWRTMPSNGETQFKTAASLWLIDNEELIKPVPEFLQTAVDHYAPQIFTTPFNKNTRNDINAWVNQNTDNYTSNALDEIDPDAVMYAVNTVEFDAKWDDEFLPAHTEEGTFTDHSGKEQKADMMGEDEMYIIEDDNATGFVKYYREERYAFAAILPDQGVSVEKYISGLTPEHFNELMAVSKIHMKDYQDGYTVSIPKFSYDRKTELSYPLKEMGIEKAFSETEADFLRLSSAVNKPFLSRILSSTYIQFGEKGTKAASASLAEGEVSAAFGMCNNRLVFDRPFVYAIIDTKADVPVFLGTLMTIPE